MAGDESYIEAQVGDSMPADGDPGRPKPEDPPEWFSSFAGQVSEQLEAVNGRLGHFGKDLGRLRERVRGSSEAGATPAPNAEQPSQGGNGSLTRDEVMAAMRYGELRGKLTEDAQSYLAELEEGGANFAELAERAEMITRFGGAASAPARAPTGQAATAAPRQAPNWPQDRAELRRLRDSNKKLYDELMSPNHPFDPTTLPQHSR